VHLASELDELEVPVPSLDGHLAACLLPDGGSLLQMRDQWNDLTRFLNLPPADPLWRRPSRAFNWLAKQERAQATEMEHQNALLRL